MDFDDPISIPYVHFTMACSSMWSLIITFQKEVFIVTA